MNHMKYWVAFIWFIYCSLVAKTLEQMQVLHKDIGNELMSIRKEFTAAQPKIYSLLDQINRMYNLAKVSLEKKHQLKIDLKNKIVENQKIQSDLNLLKTKLHEAEAERDKYSKSFTSLNKELQIEKVQSAILSREKKELDQEKHELQNKIIDAKDDKYNKKDMITDSILKDLTDEEKDLLKTSQNLTLSSTSAPSSPR
ncbi:MAG: hypothetical protein US49_C0003G0085 [candidate division TM6 bacterium GW2011_GWF2_37_49]|nr:MAG: hypothetical protein US49_C0003G0085 [candidate division TM6 bacterium GW2011_GWF2_37_49]